MRSYTMAGFRSHVAELFVAEHEQKAEQALSHAVRQGIERHIARDGNQDDIAQAVRQAIGGHAARLCGEVKPDQYGQLRRYLRQAVTIQQAMRERGIDRPLDFWASAEVHGSDSLA